MYDGSSADIATSDEAVGSSPLLNLPYELFLSLFPYMDAEDTLNLLCSCRSLYGHIRDEPIWRELCCRHGLRDLSIYSQQSFFVIYTSLMHTYGPLIGLWASDHPFTGNIVEFRLVQEPGPYPFLIGEVWRFQSHVANYCDPKLPEYLEIVSILPQWDEFGFPQPATLQWRRSLENPSFSLLAPTRLGTFLRIRDFYTNDLSTVRHPDFPSSFALWYDSERPLPRLEQEPCEDFSNQELDEDAEDGLLFIPTEDQTPPAIAFFPTSNEQFSLHRPHITFPDLRLTRRPHEDEFQPAPSRYYPLRFPPMQDHLYLDPGDVNWTRQSLDGLWIGANGAHDSEVLLVDSSHPDETMAWKITGTMHIPRGVTCWKFNPDHILPHNDVTTAMELGELPLNSRLFTGYGHICPEGFITDEDSWIELNIAVVGRDEIKIRWPELEYTARYAARRSQPDLATKFAQVYHDLGRKYPEKRVCGKKKGKFVPHFSLGTNLKKEKKKVRESKARKTKKVKKRSVRKGPLSSWVVK